MKTLKSLIAAALLVAGFAGIAQAQISVATNKNPDVPTGVFLPVYNVIDSVIVDGTLLAVDTTATVKGLGVRPYAPATVARSRIIGVAAGPIPKSSTGQSGRVLIYGFHPNAKLGAGATLIGNLKASLSVHGAFASGDSIPQVIGWSFGNRGTAQSGGAYRARIFFFGNKPGSATL